MRYRYRTGVGRNIRRDLIKTPSRRHFESKRTSKTGSTSKIGSRNGFVRFGNFCIFRSLSPHGVLNSGHKLTVTYYGEITIEPILNPEFDVDHDFEVKNGCFQSLFPRFRVISAYSTGRASHSDHFSGQASMATIFRIFIFFDEVFNFVCGTTYLMRDDGATVVNLRPSRVIWSRPNPTDLSVHPCIKYCIKHCPAPARSTRHTHAVLCTEFTTSLHDDSCVMNRRTSEFRWHARSRA